MKRVLLALLFAALCFGQSTTQSIQGIVTDPSGAAIAGAKVTVTNQGTNVSLTAVSNDTGNYTFPLLIVGDYTVKCEMTGFKNEVVRNLRLETAAQLRQNFKLDVGNVADCDPIALCFVGR